MNEERLLDLICAMHAREFLMVKTLVELIEKGNPITWNEFCLKFILSWRQDAASTIAIMRRRVEKDDLKLMMEELGSEGKEGPAPPASEEENGD